MEGCHRLYSTPEAIVKVLEVADRALAKGYPFWPVHGESSPNLWNLVRGGVMPTDKPLCAEKSDRALSVAEIKDQSHQLMQRVVVDIFARDGIRVGQALTPQQLRTLKKSMTDVYPWEKREGKRYRVCLEIRKELLGQLTFSPFLNAPKRGGRKRKTKGSDRQLSLF